MVDFDLRSIESHRVPSAIDGVINGCELAENNARGCKRLCGKQSPSAGYNTQDPRTLDLSRTPVTEQLQRSAGEYLLDA